MLWSVVSAANNLAEAARSSPLDRPRGAKAGADVELGALDFSGQCLAGSDFSDRELSGADFSDADLTGANLSMARLRGAKFCRARLDDANIGGADFSAADLSAASLEHAQACDVSFGHVDLTGASLFGADLSRSTFSRACLRNADLSTARLCEGRLREADLRGCVFGRADLTGCDFDAARVDDACFDGVQLAGARLHGVKGYERASWLGAGVHSADFTGAYLLRRFVMDQNYLHEFRSKGRANAGVYWLWWLTSDCGRSLFRWGVFTSSIAVIFAGLFTLVEVDYGDHPTWLSSIYYSLVTLTTLGYGDVTPASVGAQVIVMFEVVIGYVMLGGLLSIFANKMARRAD